MVLSLVAVANLLNLGLGSVLSYATAPEELWLGLASFAGIIALMFAAAFLPRGRIAVACLILVLANDVAFVLADMVALVQNGAWELVWAGAGGPPPQ